MTREELLEFFTTSFKRIYGPDIDISSNTPDGQIINIIIQAALDDEDLLTQIYNSFDPDEAVGKVLDQRVAINGIQRQGGTYTITPITLVNSQSINLYGLDGAIINPDVRDDGQEIFTVQDDAGNKWFLLETELGLSAGTHVLNFRAALPGEQLTVPNTITIPATIVLGVDSVNNPTSYTTLGINEESDAQLKIRRQKSVSLGSQGYYKGLLGALQNIVGVTFAAVYENVTSVTDSDGVPGHSIWVIIGGTAQPADIANAIYTKRNAGCGMRGNETYVINQVDGTPFIVNWDNVIPSSIFLTFTATSINGVTPPNIAAIRSGLVTQFTPGVSVEIDVNQLATAVQKIDPNTLVTSAGFSDGLIQQIMLLGAAESGSFKINYNGNQSAVINWDDTLGTIITKVQAVPGLEECLVTGAIGDRYLIFDLSGVSTVLGLIYVSDNSLQTAAMDPVYIGYDYAFSYTYLAPKQYQPVFTEENIVIVPMILNPPSGEVQAGADLQLTTLGGYKVYTYSIETNNSGASINSSTGLYTAGPITDVSDTVMVTDALGNTATTTVTVK